MKAIENYDLLDRCTHFTFPSNKPIEYTYEGPNLTNVSFKNYNHTYAYDTAGNIVSETRPTDEKNTYILDPLGRPTATSSFHLTQTISYDSIGNITSQTRDDLPFDYAYDPLDQLIQEVNPLDEILDYTYDSLHNRTSKNNTKYQINPFNQIESINNRTYSYDANGNLTGVNGTLKITYDALDRPIIFTILDHSQIRLTYDAQHRRLTKETFLFENYAWVPISSEKYLWQGN